MEVNNREWALLIWFGALAFAALCVPAGRRAIVPAAKALAKRKLLVPLALLVLYVGAVIVFLIVIQVWDAKLITPTIIWFLTVAIVLYFRLNRAINERHYFRKVVVDAVSFPVVVQFILDLHPFSLPGELFLQGLILFFGLMHGVAMATPEQREASKFTGLVLSILTLVIVVHSIVEISTHWNQIDLLGEARKFLLPIGMTAAVLPFIYCFALVAAYETAWVRMRRTVPAGTSEINPVIALILKCGLRLRPVADISPKALMGMAQAGTVRGAKSAYEQAKTEDARCLKAAADEKERLKVRAGMLGTDEEGKQLDQREFQETKAALDYLHTCHMGHYRQRGMYRADMLDYLGAETFARKGLPPESGMSMTVASDGQSWWAWRRTVTGWVLGIGAGEAPPDRWEFDGPEPPTGPPGTSPHWRHFMVPPEAHHHW